MKYIAVTVYILIMSVLGFFAMLADKRRAINGKRRLSENSLFAIALLGGGIGSLIGMYVFRHKTKHALFVVGMPLAAIIIPAFIYAVTYLV